MTFVYLIYSGRKPGATKVGIADDVDQRLATFQTANAHRDFVVYKTYECASRAEAFRLEGRIIAAGRDAGWWGSGEWLLMTPSVVASMVEDMLNEPKNDPIPRPQRPNLFASKQIEEN